MTPHFTGHCHLGYTRLWSSCLTVRELLSPAENTVVLEVERTQDLVSSFRQSNARLSFYISTLGFCNEGFKLFWELIIFLLIWERLPVSLYPTIVKFY